MSDNISILPIVVIYKAVLPDCAVYKHLHMTHSFADIVLYDNSPKAVNEGYANKHIHYFHDSANGGVSAAYNYGAKWAMQHGYRYLLLLDQDTEFDVDFIEKMCTDIKRYPQCPLFVPQIVVKSNNMPFSPSKIGLWSIKGVILSPGLYSLSKYKPVNSGSCILLSAFAKVDGYNEHIKLDFADFDFFMRLNNTVSNFCVIDSRAYQNFSNEETDCAKAFERFKFYVEGAKQFSKPFVILPIVIRHILALTIRMRSLKFIKYYFKSLLS